jgi:LysR family glycine cleavage system transcriptional activator
VLRLHLGVLPLFGGQRLFPRLPELRKLHPRLHIDIDSGPRRKRGWATRSTRRLSCRRSRTGAHSVRLDHNKVYAIRRKALAEELGPCPMSPSFPSRPS